MYNWFAAFWRNVERARERALYADAHSRLYAQGFWNQVSFYGTLVEPYDGVHDQVRIEVVSRTELTPDQVDTLYKAMNVWRPAKEYTLIAVTHQGMKEVVPL